MNTSLYGYLLILLLVELQFISANRAAMPWGGGPPRVFKAPPPSGRDDEIKTRTPLSRA